MDLSTVETMQVLRTRADAGGWTAGDAWLAGGTWLFSEPQIGVRRLRDLSAMGWAPVMVSDAGVAIAATCTVAQLTDAPLPAHWPAGALVDQCAQAFLSSFKVQHMATVGGNLCAALPAGPMISLAAALDGECEIWAGERSRVVPAVDFVVGDGRTVLAPGELLREIRLPARALSQRSAFRQMSLTPLGRSAALLIGLRDPATGALALTVTAATKSPVRLVFAAPPTPGQLRAALDAGIRAGAYHDDVHGHPVWRRHLTYLLAAQIVDELS
ncbi:MAG: hypothetical protein JWN20_1867 [Jatrophihabitantaceae bacterium]|nr:hypothetical protein [Jatrophihabitantaceae bacterium]